MLGDHTNVSVTWVVLAGGDQRSNEAAGAAEEFLTGARTSQIKIEEFKLWITLYDFLKSFSNC